MIFSHITRRQCNPAKIFRLNIIYADIYDKVVIMKGKYLIGIFLLILAIPFFFGCASRAPAAALSAPPPPPPPEMVFVQSPPETLVPLTLGILQRLIDTNAQLSEISKYQLLLFGRVFLERNFTQSSNRLETGGKITFEDLHIREEVTIQDQTEGQALEFDIVDNEIILSVCFEREPRYENCMLQFSTMAWDTDGYFYLKYNNNPSGRGYLNDEKGLVLYGGPEYKIKFTSERSPYLLIKLSQRDIERVNSRTASGRKIQ